MTRKLLLALGLFLAFAPPVLADPAMRVVTPVRDIARGEIIADSDLVYGTVQGSALMSGVITSMDAVKGMEARRILRAGEVIALSDVRRPVVVNKGQAVTMTFEAPGVELTAMGRAMGEGGIGDTVVVQNPASFRMVNAVVTGAGTVRASGPAAPMANQLTALK